MGKQMEGDNTQRRKKAAEARAAGETPSEQGATFGASKQRHRLGGDAEHPETLEAQRRGKQAVIRENTPKPKPGSRSRKG
jgi:hypothetical protein